MLGVDLVATDGSWLLTLDALSVQTAPDGSRRIVWVIKRMIKAIRQIIGWQGKQPSIRHPICLPRSGPPLSRLADLYPALTGPAASRVVAEDTYQPLPVQYRVDQVTVEERDGVDVGQPWVRLDVEVGLSGQWRDGQDLVDLGQPSLGLG
jgi:hypothetical protein